MPRHGDVLNRIQAAVVPWPGVVWRYFDAEGGRVGLRWLDGPPVHLVRQAVSEDLDVVLVRDISVAMLLAALLSQGALTRHLDVHRLREEVSAAALQPEMVAVAGAVLASAGWLSAVAATDPEVQALVTQELLPRAVRLAQAVSA